MQHLSSIFAIIVALWLQCMSDTWNYWLLSKFIPFSWVCVDFFFFQTDFFFFPFQFCRFHTNSMEFMLNSKIVKIQCKSTFWCMFKGNLNDLCVIRELTKVKIVEFLCLWLCYVQVWINSVSCNLDSMWNINWSKNKERKKEWNEGDAILTHRKCCNNKS